MIVSNTVKDKDLEQETPRIFIDKIDQQGLPSSEADRL
jgi:hypothetical protein